MTPLRLPDLEELLDGMGLGEAPRWHDGRLWFVDMFAGRVLSADVEAGVVDVVAAFDDHTSGIGFLPDGVPLVVLKRAKQIVALEAGGPRVHADLSGYHADGLNDMVVDEQGRAYVDLLTTPPTPRASPDPLTEGDDRIVLVEPSGAHRVVAEGLVRPNGLAITADGRELVVAETPADRLRVLTIDQADGSLGDVRPFAALGAASADGICLDVQGAAWCASPYTGQVLRVLPGGEVTHEIVAAGTVPTACVLGGVDRRTLFVTAVRGKAADVTPGTAVGFVASTTVEVPGAGWP